ncbi:MAG TPA: hypothetical protein VGM80_17455, partial [Gaiellaceae bacterium]
SGPPVAVTDQPPASVAPESVEAPVETSTPLSAAFEHRTDPSPREPSPTEPPPPVEPRAPAPMLREPPAAAPEAAPSEPEVVPPAPAEAAEPLAPPGPDQPSEPEQQPPDLQPLEAQRVESQAAESQRAEPGAAASEPVGQEPAELERPEKPHGVDPQPLSQSQPPAPPALELEQLQEAWRRLVLPAIERRVPGGIPAAAMLSEAHPTRLENETLTLEFAAQAQFHRQRAEDPKSVALLQEGLYEVTGHRFEIAFVTGQPRDPAELEAEQPTTEEGFVELMKTTFDAEELDLSS